MELRVRTVPIVTFYYPTTDTTVTGATYSFNGSAPAALAPSAPVDGAVMATLPYQQSEGRVDVEWTFSIPGSGTHTLNEKYEVVTPLLTRREVLVVAPDLTNDQADMLEANVRNAIQSLTGQTFGYFDGTYQVSGTGRTALELPSRLISLSSFNGDTDHLGDFVIDGDGYLLTHYPWGVPPIKADFYGVNEATVQTTGVMHDPRIYRLGLFNTGLVYNISGKWGFESVPESVKEAARMLVNDYSCADIEYRDRYLTSMTAADWRIQFNSGAFVSTGNARADRLIEPYIFKYKWRVF